MSVGRIARRTREVLKEDGLIEVIKRVLRYIKRRIKDKLDNNALTYRKNYEEEQLSLFWLKYKLSLFI